MNKNIEQSHNISFEIHMPWEFIYSLYVIGGIDSYLKRFKENKITIEASYMNLIKDCRGKLSKFLRNELDFFFDSLDDYHGIGFAMCYDLVMNFLDVPKVDDFIECVQNTNENFLMASATEYVFKICSGENVSDLSNWSEIKTDNKKMLDIVSDLNIANPKLKERINEMLQNPLETKERFCLLLRQFYEKVFKDIEDQMYDKLLFFKNRYSEIYSKDNAKFINKYLLTKSIDLEKFETKVHVSYFHYYLESSFSDEDKNILWFILGAYSDKYLLDEDNKETMLQLFKTLSDSKRYNIIELLSERPWYVYELADELNLSAATISYHLNMLLEFRLIKYERSDHRIYYSLDKERLKELLNKISKNLLKE